MDIKETLYRTDGLARHLNIIIEEAHDGYARATMPLDDCHKNGMGSAHGAAIFAVADLAFAAASCTEEYLYVNAQTSISYLAKSSEGPLVAEARRINKARTLPVFEVEVRAGETLVAVCQITGFGKKMPENQMFNQ